MAPRGPGREPHKPPAPAPPPAKPLLTRHNPVALQALKLLAREEDTTLTALVAEGLNHVLRTRGRPPLF